LSADGIQQLADTRVMPTYRRLPVTFVRGEGVHLYDDRGKRYLDFMAGVAVNALGHAHPAVTEAVARQSSLLVHTSNLFYTEPMAQLADRLAKLLGWPDGRAFFANSGAEANECAIKLVRRWAGSRFGPDRYHTIAALGAFHGRTLETLAATGQPAKWKPFSPLPPGFTHVAYDDSAAIERAITGRESSVLLEPVQGEAGVVVPSDDYLPAVRQICSRHDLAFIADEVQTGLGRTGEWFGFQLTGAIPDVITLAKALGNGLPIGACVARGELAEAFRPGDHATTVGGGPVVCAAALAVLETMEKDALIANSRAVGAYLKSKLERLALHHELVGSVRGRGLLLAMELKGDAAGTVVRAALDRGLLVNDVTPSAVRLCPPLTVDRAQCDEAVEILDVVLGHIPAVVSA
jgi:predicted acetylornithine/succinylornithine family transaminase